MEKMALAVQENIVSAVLYSGAWKKLNGLDKLQKILDMQAGQALVFWLIVCFSYAK